MSSHEEILKLLNVNELSKFLYKNHCNSSYNYNDLSYHIQKKKPTKKFLEKLCSYIDYDLFKIFIGSIDIDCNVKIIITIKENHGEQI